MLNAIPVARAARLATAMVLCSTNYVVQLVADPLISLATVKDLDVEVAAGATDEVVTVLLANHTNMVNPTCFTTTTRRRNAEHNRLNSMLPRTPFPLMSVTSTTRINRSCPTNSCILIPAPTIATTMAGKV